MINSQKLANNIWFSFMQIIIVSDSNGLEMDSLLFILNKKITLFLIVY